MTNKLFDRIINIELIRKNGTRVFLTCPKTGRKPSITISGQFTGGIVSHFTLKLVNFYSSSTLDNDGQGGSSYEFIRVYAGYGDKIYTALSGQVFVAYQAKPGPDHEVVMECLVASYENWVTKSYNKNWAKGTPLNTIFREMASLLSTTSVRVGLRSYIPDSLVLNSEFSACSSVAESADKLSKAYGLNAVPEGEALVVLPVSVEGVSTGIVHVLDFVTSVKKSAAGVTVTAPWVPNIKPFDTVRVDSRYFSVDYGGTAVQSLIDYMVITVDFSFSTNGTENTMTLLTAGLPKVNKAYVAGRGAQPP